MALALGLGVVLRRRLCAAGVHARATLDKPVIIGTELTTARRGLQARTNPTLSNDDLLFDAAGAR